MRCSGFQGHTKIASTWNDHKLTAVLDTWSLFKDFNNDLVLRKQL